MCLCVVMRAVGSEEPKETLGTLFVVVVLEVLSAHGTPQTKEPHTVSWLVVGSSSCLFLRPFPACLVLGSSPQIPEK